MAGWALSALLTAVVSRIGLALSACPSLSTSTHSSQCQLVSEFGEADLLTAVAGGLGERLGRALLRGQLLASRLLISQAALGGRRRAARRIHRALQPRRARLLVLAPLVGLPARLPLLGARRDGCLELRAQRRELALELGLACGSSARVGVRGSITGPWPWAGLRGGKLGDKPRELRLEPRLLSLQAPADGFQARPVGLRLR